VTNIYTYEDSYVTDAYMNGTVNNIDFAGQVTNAWTIGSSGNVTSFIFAKKAVVPELNVYGTATLINVTEPMYTSVVDINVRGAANITTLSLAGPIISLYTYDTSEITNLDAISQGNITDLMIDSKVVYININGGVKFVNISANGVVGTVNIQQNATMDNLTVVGNITSLTSERGATLNDIFLMANSSVITMSLNHTVATLTCEADAYINDLAIDYTINTATLDCDITSATIGANGTTSSCTIGGGSSISSLFVEGQATSMKIQDGAVVDTL